jgi:hypothetical protein
MLGLVLGFQDLFEEIEIGEVLGGGFLGQSLEACGQMGQAQPLHVPEKAFRL